MQILLPHQEHHCLERSSHHHSDVVKYKEHWDHCRKLAEYRSHGAHPLGTEIAIHEGGSCLIQND